MDYYEGVIKNTEFFTTSELAEKLKMNVQVITRKVQAGEISAYKIGKDWRIPEQSVYDWLQARSNRNGEVMPKRKTARRNVRLTKKGETSDSDRARTSSGPSRKYMLEYILAQFEPNRLYEQREVNRMINRYNDNPDDVRRDFVENHMLEEIDGKYRRNKQYNLSEA